eukprot:scaffold1748_cov258-Pinguiococcus_pyrenoidosus.AAC.16
MTNAQQCYGCEQGCTEETPDNCQRNHATAHSPAALVVAAVVAVVVDGPMLDGDGDGAHDGLLAAVPLSGAAGKAFPRLSGIRGTGSHAGAVARGNQGHLDRLRPGEIHGIPVHSYICLRVLVVTHPHCQPFARKARNICRSLCNADSASRAQRGFRCGQVGGLGQDDLVQEVVICARVVEREGQKGRREGLSVIEALQLDGVGRTRT